MPFVGATPNSLFTFRPVRVSVSEEWRTLASEFETGAEQRRSKWIRPRMTVTMGFDRGTLTPDQINDMWRFFRAMEGSHKAFDLPLFGRLTTVESDFTAGGSIFGFADTQEFTSAADSRYNHFYVQNAGGGFRHIFDFLCRGRNNRRRQSGALRRCEFRKRRTRVRGYSCAVLQ